MGRRFETGCERKFMKLTQSLIVAALAVFAGSATLQAQNATNRPPAKPPPAGFRGVRGGLNADQLATALKLDDATKARVKTILDTQQQKVRDLLADAALSPADRRAKMQALREGLTAQMKAVLTAEQFDQWQKMNPLLQRRAPPAGNPPPVAPHQ